MPVSVMRKFAVTVSAAGLAVATLLPAHAQHTQEVPEPASVESQNTDQTPQASTIKQKNSDKDRPERAAECAWLGQRIVGLLWRDDVNTAREQTRFYDLFGCPPDHLRLAFRCVIEQSESQPEQNDLTARVYACWMSPEETATEE